jgi:glycosyltransferase involved in cell wall biosynthesis
MPDSPHTIRVAFSVTNCICHDQRVQKISEAVSKLGCEITIIGRKSGDCCENNKVPFRTVRFRMVFNKGFLFYKFFNLRLFFYLLFHNYDLLVANDLDTLLSNFLVSAIKRLPLVYDSHEYFTGVPEIQHRPFVKWTWRSIEKMIFPHLKYIMTVSESIADQYESEYRRKSSTVRNCSRSASGINGFSREELDISKEDLLVILQGGGINVDRGGEELIEAVSMTGNISLLIAGSGDVLPDLKKKVGMLGLSGRIRFIPKLPWAELIRYTKSADAGLSLDKDSNLNYRYSLPNKLFDYISAGIPVIASDLPEIRKIIEGYDCGILIKSVTPENIKLALQELQADRDHLNQLKQNAVKASERLSWETESKKVIDFYTDVLTQNSKL